MYNKQEWLRERKSYIESLYHDSFMSQEEIGKVLGLPQGTISCFMRKNNIKTRIAAKRDQRGTKNHMWKGNDISYKGAHHRVRLVRGKPNQCIKCGTTEKKLEWASISKKHHDPYDYQAMCLPCHRQHDMNLRKAKIQKKCPVCGKEWIVGLKLKNQIYCSYKCYGIAQSSQVNHQDIINLYQSGNSQRQIAEKYNISQKTISNILKKYNIARVYIAPANKILHKINPDEVKDLYNKGMNQASIGKLLSISPRSVSNIMRFYNIPVRNAGTKEFYYA
jgi:predicted transcriptional regulator/endogenous inhibitor of DNA gyrase (YacG/DUF329 family)